MKYIFLIFLIFISLAARADNINLYFIRSPYGINWKNPWTLTVSTLKNQIVSSRKRRPHTISHAYVELNCNSTGTHMLRGMTSDGNTQERELVLREHYGLGVIFHTYDGILEKDPEILEDLNDYKGNKRLSKLSLKISPKTCARLVDYAEDYEAKGYGRMYSGLQADPLKGEGSGCSAFVVSFLRVGGLMQSFTQQWKEIIDVPLKYVGGPITQKKVKLTKMLKSVKSKWGNHLPHIHLEGWNPERMHKWVLKSHREIANNSSILTNAKIDQYKFTRMVELDLSHLPTPEGDFWEMKEN